MVDGVPFVLDCSIPNIRVLQIFLFKEVRMHLKMYCVSCGNILNDGDKFCNSCGANVVRNDEVVSISINSISHDDDLIRKLSDYEKVSGILWMILGVIQVVTVIGVIAGIWNLFAGYSRIKISPRILRKDIKIPDEFEGMADLIIIGVINMVLGGFVGLVFVAFDYIIRDKILTNKHLFTETIKENL